MSKNGSGGGGGGGGDSGRRGVEFMHVIIEYWIRFVPLPLQAFVDVIFNQPLRLLYFSGPRLPMETGFWEGVGYHQICSELTNHRTDSSHWILNEQNFRDCEEMVNRRYYSFVILVVVPLYFYFLWRIIWHIIRRIL